MTDVAKEARSAVQPLLDMRSKVVDSMHKLSSYDTPISQDIKNVVSKTKPKLKRTEERLKKKYGSLIGEK